MFDAIVEALREAKTEISDTLEKLEQPIVEGLQEVKQEISDALEKLEQPIVKGLQEIVSELRELRDEMSTQEYTSRFSARQLTVDTKGIDINCQSVYIQNQGEAEAWLLFDGDIPRKLKAGGEFWWGNSDPDITLEGVFAIQFLPSTVTVNSVTRAATQEVLVLREIFTEVEE